MPTQKGLKHIIHLEDLIITDGSSGALTAFKILKDVIDLMRGRNKDNIHLAPKIDGAPSLVFGYYKDTFFVSTKSVFNKDPKIAFNNEDIDTLFGGSDEDLRAKLKVALHYLKNVTPMGKIYQGDFLFTDRDLKITKINGNEYFTFEPNTITYAIPTDSDEGKKIAEAKIGIVVHTKYDSLNNPNPIFTVTEDEFVKEADVWLRTPDTFMKTLKSDDSDYRELRERFTKAYALYQKLDKSAIDFISDNFSIHLMSFQNYIIKNQLGKDLNSERKYFDAFRLYVIKWFTKRINNYKTNAKKEETTKDLQEFKKLLDKDMYKFHAFLIAYKTMTILKLEILDILSNSLKLKAYIDKSNLIPISGEGFVVTYKNKIIKLVNRPEFSYYNFNISKFQHTLKEATSLFLEYSVKVKSDNKVISDKIQDKDKSILLTFGRFNPPTSAHLVLMKTMAFLAKQFDINARVYVSHTQEPKRNPLPYNYKVKLLKSIAPEPVVVKKSSLRQIFQVVEFLYKEKGYRTFYLVLGGDRATEFAERFKESDYLKKELPDLNLITVDIGRYLPVSSTQARAYIRNNKFTEFEKISPFNAKVNKEIFNKIREVSK